MTANCIGWVPLSMTSIIISIKGKPFYKEVVANLPDASRTIMDKRLVAASWYPYHLFPDLLASYELLAGNENGDGSYELGYIGGKIAIEEQFAVYQLTDPKRFVVKLPHIWSLHFTDAGRLEMSEWDSEGCRIRIWDFPEMHRLHFRQATGYLKSSFKNVGLKFKDDVTLVTNMRKDDSLFHEWTFSWEGRENDSEKT